MANIERTKNASRSIFFGILLKLYQLIVPFLMRTAMIYLLGVQYLGLNSLFISILQVLNLAELGIGSAMVYSMYKPIADDNEKVICALLKLYKKYYRTIGGVIAFFGLLLTPFIPKLITGSIPQDINIYILYILNLTATVLSYWLFAYRSCILQAYQRNDIISKVTLITNTGQYFFQILFLFLFKNYYIYVIVLLIFQCINNLITACMTRKYYPQYKPIGNITLNEKRSINNRIKDLFTAKLGSVIYDSADTIVISAFLGLKILAIYQNYYYILSAVFGVVSVIFTACMAGIGNSLIVETKHKNYMDFKKLTFIICWISGNCSVCLLCLYQPFMKLWVGSDLMLEFSAVICLVIYFFIRQINSLLNLYKDAAGMWHEDRFRPLIAALVNLILNLILVNIIGIYGIIISTVAAIFFVGMPWLIYNLFTVLFEKKYIKEYCKTLIYYSTIVLISAILTFCICKLLNFNMILEIFIRGILCIIIPNVVYYFAYRNKKEYIETLSLINRVTKGEMTKVLTKIGMKN